MIERISNTAAIAVRQAGAYTDLILSDLDASADVVKRRVALGAVALLATHLTLAMGCVLLVAASWDSQYRLWVIAGLFIGFAAVAAISMRRLGAAAAGAPGLLAQTSREWAKDRQLLEELLARQRGEAR